MTAAANPSLGGFSPKTSIVETDLAGRLCLATDESTWVKSLLIGGSLAFLTLVLFVPLAAIFAQALRKGRWRLQRQLHRPARTLGDSPNTARRLHLRATELGLRPRRRVGDHKIPIP